MSARRIAGSPGAVAAAPTWHALTPDDALARVGSSERGLSSKVAAERLAGEGPNELEGAKPTSWARVFANQWRSLIVWTLIVAAIASAVLGDVVDAVAIAGILLLNAGIGFYQELHAEQAMAALKQMTAPLAKVLREAVVDTRPASELVVGDVIVLEAGDVVPADARLISASALRCVEAALTGESEAAAKRADTVLAAVAPLGDRTNMVFMATMVAAGAARAVVVATAMRTELGGIAGLLDEVAADPKTPLQRKLDAFGGKLVWAALGVVALLFGLGLLRDTPLLELTMTAVGLAVAAVPEGLPTVVTVALSLGVLRMARRKALVRRLAAVETLGSTTVICTDKTGTLTVGEMTARACYVAGRSYTFTGDGYGPDGEVQYEGVKADGAHVAPLNALATVLVGCNQAHLASKDGAWQAVGDPTEAALLSAGLKAGVDRERLERDLPKVAENPFDSDRKCSSIVRRTSGGAMVVLVHGAPGPLLERCDRILTADGVRPLETADRMKVLGHATEMASRALRVLGSARREWDAATPGPLTAAAVEQSLVFVGLTGMQDPPRQEAAEAIARCRTAGIRVVMITGDHPETARAIAESLGVLVSGAVVVGGAEIEAMNDDVLAAQVGDIAVYARVTAQHKLRIVRALKRAGAVVAMTGDGVNDAPAIKGADIGIAMGKTGTEVTKQAADMVIADDNFATIVAAIEEGRGIYDNIQKTLKYLLAGNAGELLLMAACVVIGLPAPLLATHLLWINVVTDGLPALCLATDPIDSDVMRRSPRDPRARLANGRFFASMALTGLLTAGVGFGVYYYALVRHGTETARTCTFAVMVFAELLRSFGARSDTKPLWEMRFFANRNLIAVVATSIAFQLWTQHNDTLARFLRTSPVPWSDALVLLAIGAIPLATMELVKVARRAFERAAPPPVPVAV